MDCHGGAALARGLMAMQLGEHQDDGWQAEYAEAALHADPLGMVGGSFQHAPQFDAPPAPAHDGLSRPWAETEAAPVDVGDGADEWIDQYAEATTDPAWVDACATDIPLFGVEGEPLLTVDEKTRQSQFYTFMRRVRAGELRVNDALGTVEDVPWATDGDAAERWAADLAGQDMSDNDDLMDAWAANAGEVDEFAQEYLAQGEGDATSWADEYLRAAQTEQARDIGDYPFDPNNPFVYHDDPHMEGLSLLAAGSLAEAVLAFEAAVLREPERDDLWKILGTTQAENEKDNMALRALTQARQRNPHDPSTHLALAVSFTNECHQHQALEALKTWLLCQPTYERLADVPVEESPDADDVMLFISPSEHRHVQQLFAAATELNSNDADLYVAQGVLRNLSHEYDEAAASFRNALRIRPDDPRLWNKLGATLANGNRSDDALAAYDRALDLSPGFVRARYNLSIAHSNVGNHRAASEHLLRAIVMQQGGVEMPDPPTRSTRELWDVLRINLNLLNRGDLVDLTYKQDVVPFLASLG